MNQSFLAIARTAMKRLLTTIATLATMSSGANAETSVLKSLPEKVQKSIEETRAACRGIGGDGISVTSDDDGLVTFTLDGKQAVLIDDVLLCGGCYHGFNCSNRGTRVVEVYIRRGSSWARAISDRDISVTGDIFVSFKPGYPGDQRDRELNALVVNHFVGNRECPTRIAASTSAQSWEARSCVVRWNGARFTYKPL
jgi:hypothetical protein